jgi:hypothetical protein
MFHEKRPPAAPDTDDFPHLNPRLFRTRDGRMWLERMSRNLFDLMLGPNVPEAMLRYLEGQRDIIRRIKNDIAAAEKAETDKPTP